MSLYRCPFWCARKTVPSWAWHGQCWGAVGISILQHYDTPPRVSTSKQMSHTLTGLFKSNLMMGISFIEHLWHNRRPQWRLESTEKAGLITKKKEVKSFKNNYYACVLNPSYLPVMFACCNTKLGSTFIAVGPIAPRGLFGQHV